MSPAAPQRPIARLAALAALALLIVAGSTLLGPTRVGWSDIFGAPGDESFGYFWQFRAPRTALAALAGAGLAIGGVIFQSLLRNPLAEPYTLGIAGWACRSSACWPWSGRSRPWPWSSPSPARAAGRT